MARTKSTKPVRKERLLQVLTNGGVITKKQIEDTMKYKAMYRISTELWKLKNMGAVVKSHKDGRNVIGYELINVDEMKALLKKLGFDTLPLVTESKAVQSLGDLKAAPAEVVEVSEVEEVTEE